MIRGVTDWGERSNPGLEDGTVPEIVDSGGCSTCNGCNSGMPMGHGGHPQSGGYGPQQYPQAPPVMQGTLVFPNHQFVRSPRDFFMYEPGK